MSKKTSKKRKSKKIRYIQKDKNKFYHHDNIISFVKKYPNFVVTIIVAFLTAFCTILSTIIIYSYNRPSLKVDSAFKILSFDFSDSIIGVTKYRIKNTN